MSTPLSLSLGLAGAIVGGEAISYVHNAVQPLAVRKDLPKHARGVLRLCETALLDQEFHKGLGHGVARESDDGDVVSMWMRSR